jgi:hypothetical protein
MVPQALAMSSSRHPSAFILTPQARHIHQQQQQHQMFEAMEVRHGRLSVWGMTQKTRSLPIAARLSSPCTSTSRAESFEQDSSGEQTRKEQGCDKLI